ncbi:MAG: hypothetical protein HBSAPP03_03400 [Phycisphaerae bacterium]|nr:MAG: hypothetical protein HBSAPP03_03400 [Phycisphaerae bacterium]
MCVRVWDWSETSQTVSVFTRAHGVVRAVAKGAKRDHARFSGGLEVLTRGQVGVSLKGGEALSILTSWDLVETFPAARTSLRSFHAGMLMLDVAHRAVHDHDPHGALYDALVAGARSLGEPRAEAVGLLRLVWAAVSDTGHRPQVVADAGTQAALPDASTYGFAPRLGGVVRDGGDGGGGPVWRVRAETVALLRALAEGRGGVDRAEAATVDRATRLLLMYYREVFAVDPPTIRRFLGE